MESFLCNYLKKQIELNKFLLLMCFLLGIFSTTTIKAQIYGNDIYSPLLKYYDIATNTWSTKFISSQNIRSVAYLNNMVYATDFVPGNISPAPLPRLSQYNSSTNKWTVLDANSGILAAWVIAAKGVIYYGAGGLLKKYDPATNTVVALTPLGTSNPITTVSQVSYDGDNYIYGYSGNVRLSRYNIATNTYELLTISCQVVPTAVAYLNSVVYYTALNKGLYKYDPIADTHTIVSSITNGQAGMTTDGTNLYIGGSGGFFKYDLTANTWTTLSSSIAFNSLTTSITPCSATAAISIIPATCSGSTANNNAQIIVNTFSGATKVDYSLGSTYTGAGFTTATIIGTTPYTVVNNLPNPTTNQPYTIRVFNSSTCYKDTVVTLHPSVVPTATASAVSASCAGLLPNSDAQLILNTFTEASKYGYSVGETYTGVGFSTATALGGTVPFTIVNNLDNPVADQLYTIRIFSSATCYKDMSLILPTQICASADLSIAVSPNSLTKNGGETATYTITVTNNGPNTATNAIVKVSIPQGRTFLSAQLSQGSYDSNTEQWTIGILPNGSNATITISIGVN